MPATTTPKKIWTVLEILQWGSTYLTDKGIDEARLTIELMLAAVLGYTRIQLYLHFDKPLQESELVTLRLFFQRRLDHEPLQYILGKTEFMGLQVDVDRRVLIPRPETEIIIEKAIHWSRERAKTEEIISILEIGTGSGCIAVAIAHHIKHAKVLALDISGDALAVARHNAELHRVSERIEFGEADIFQWNVQQGKHLFQMIISNPPYINKTEYDQLPPEIRLFEPVSALTDGGDGSGFFRRIAQVGKDVLANDGCIIVEHAYNQQEEVTKIFSSEGYNSIGFLKDYSGTPRGVCAERK